MTGRQKYEKNMFFIAAVWNWVISLIFVAVAIIDKDSLTFFMKDIPNNMLWFNVTLAAIFLFGYGYYCISTDVPKNSDIIKLGILGKWVIFILFLMEYVNGNIALISFLVSVGDLIFSLMFLDVLIKLKRTYR